MNFFGQTAFMDPQGRILLHPLVRERAGLKGEVSVLGQQDHLEVWNQEIIRTGLKENPMTDQDRVRLAEQGI